MEASTPDITFEVLLIKNVITIRYDGTVDVPLQVVRIDGTHYNFINYVRSRPRTQISRGEIRLNVDGCSKRNDLTELVRYCGFDKKLKKYFFPICTAKKIWFEQKISIPLGEALALNIDISEAMRKNRKIS